MIYSRSKGRLFSLSVIYGSRVHLENGFHVNDGNGKAVFLIWGSVTW